jgi:hypothetical protein
LGTFLNLYISAFDLEGKILIGKMPGKAKKMIKTWALEKIRS